MSFRSLSQIQQNILFASIIGDGEITKCYPNSRRKNNSYREHYGQQQEQYRVWKASFFDGQLYIRSKSQSLVSKSDPYFTKLYSHFYDDNGQKTIPVELLPICTLPHFLTILYLDDGSLSITKRLNNRKKLVFLTPHIFLYLQNYPLDELLVLQSHIHKHFGIKFKINRRPDGFGYVLRLTTVLESLDFLQLILPIANSCPNMEYKYDWDKRFQIEKGKLEKQFPNYRIVSSDSSRWSNYTDEEIAKLIHYKREGKTDKQIALELNRTYWSIVYKLRESSRRG